MPQIATWVTTGAPQTPPGGTWEGLRGGSDLSRSPCPSLRPSTEAKTRRPAAMVTAASPPAHPPCPHYNHSPLPPALIPGAAPPATPAAGTRGAVGSGQEPARPFLGNRSPCSRGGPAVPAQVTGAQAEPPGKAGAFLAPSPAGLLSPLVPRGQLRAGCSAKVSSGAESPRCAPKSAAS